MKNLKRVLSLGLASVMLLGMMVMGASAKDFTDAADIEHTEAVETMVALKIINGKEDGSTFAPKDNVSRAEMAKMIAVAMNGGSEANTGVKTTPTFTDIKGHWAEGWIEYCADMQIINGRGDGTFDPNGQVTGVEALKMVLTALGYNADAYGLVGASWAAQTIERARATAPVKLVDELADVVLTAPATRDTAAQMIWNGLQATAVTTTPDQNKSNGEITWTYGSAGVTLLKQRYDADIATGEYVGNYDAGNGGLKGEIAVKVPTSNGGSTVWHFPSELSIDNMGEEVKVVWRDGAKGSKNEADGKDVIYGCFNTGATRVVKSQMSKVKETKNAKAVLNIDGTVYDTEATVDVITNYDTDATRGNVKTLSATDGTTSGGSSLNKALKYNSGTPFKVTFNSNGEIEKIFVTKSYLGAVTAVNSTSVTVSNGIGNLKFEDNYIEEGLKKGDVVVATPYYDLSAWDKATVTVKKADKKSGELTAFVAEKANEVEKVTVDGKEYKINYKADKNAANPAGTYDLPNVGSSKLGLIEIPNLTDGNVAVTGFNGSNNAYIEQDMDLYLVDGYVCAIVQTSETANNYSVITEVKTSGSSNSVFGGLQLQVMGVDGTKEIITVSSKSSKDNAHSTGDISTASYSVGDIITYTFNDKDEAKVNIVAPAASSTAFKYNASAKTVNNKLVTTADCALFVQTNDDANFGTIDTTHATANVGTADWEVYSIRELDDINATDVVAVAKNNDGKVVAVFVNLEKTPDGAADDTVYGIVTTGGTSVKDYTRYTVQSNGEEYTINTEDTFKKGDLVKFRPTANNNYTTGKVAKILKTDADYFTAFVKEYDSKADTLTYYSALLAKDANGVYPGDSTTQNTYALAKDAKIIYVDADGKTSKSEASIDAYNNMGLKDGAEAPKQNAAFITKLADGDTVISILFVETSGKAHVNNNSK